MEYPLKVFDLQVTEIQPKLVPAIKEHINSWKRKWLGVFGFSYRWVQGLKTTTSQDLELNYLFSGAWSGFNFMLPKNRVWTVETKQGNFKQKKPGKHHVGQVIKVNMASDKSF